jgi:hypothetical protein
MRPMLCLVQIVGLKAVLFQREQEAKRFKVTGEARPRVLLLPLTPTTRGSHPLLGLGLS